MTTAAPTQPGAALRAKVGWISGAVFALVALLLFAPRPPGVAGALEVSALPWVNAGLNTIGLGWLLTGFAAVKTGRIAVHRFCMTAAMVTGAVFLLSYVTYHLFSPGPAHYTGAWRGTYLFVLLTHVVLAAVILPASMNTWIRGYTGDRVAHRRLARPTLAAWIYVSVTGIVVTFMAHPL